MYGRGKKLSKSKIQKQSEENLINSIGNPFILKKETKNILIKDWIIRDIRTLFEKKEEEKETKDITIKDLRDRDVKTLLEEEDYYKLKSQKRVSNFWNNNYIDMK